MTPPRGQETQLLAPAEYWGVKGCGIIFCRLLLPGGRMRWSLNCFVSKTCACVYCLSLVSPWLVALRIEGHMKRGTMACVPSSALMSLGVLLAGFAVYVPRTEHRTPCRTDSDSMSLGWLLWPRPTFGKTGTERPSLTLQGWARSDHSSPGERKKMS